MVVKISGNSSPTAPSFAGDDGDSGLHASADQVQLVTNSTVAMTVDASQRVGIGTSTPNELLEVRGTENQGIRLTSTAGSGEGANLQWYSMQTGDNKITAEIESDGSGTGGNLFFKTRSTAGVLTDRMVIDNSGNVGIGTSPFAKLQVNTGTNENLWVGSLGGSGAGVYLASVNDAASVNTPMQIGSASVINFAISGTERMKIASDGALFSVPVYNSTTAAAANVSIGSNGHFQRSTSSVKYKTDVETLENKYADALLQCRPVWYHSICAGDNPLWSYWGFIAEEVAEIDPRLVHWKTVEITYDEKGSAVESPCDPEPEGVAYERFVPHLLNLIKRQKEQIETLETINASFEARISALEGGN